MKINQYPSTLQNGSISQAQKPQASKSFEDHYVQMKKDETTEEMMKRVEKMIEQDNARLEKFPIHLEKPEANGYFSTPQTEKEPNTQTTSNLMKQLQEIAIKDIIKTQAEQGTKGQNIDLRAFLDIFTTSKLKDT